MPGGLYRISAEENAAVCHAVGAIPDPTGRAHPIYFYIISQVASGMSVSELCAACGYAPADGLMLSQSQVHFAGELAIGRDYHVSGQIVSLVRKPSRTFGELDVLTFRLTLAETVAGPAIAACEHSWVFPTRGRA